MKFIYWILMILISSQAIAALPSEDSYVKDLRERFRTAGKPLETDLYELVFNCEGRMATQGNYQSDFMIDELRFFRTIGHLPFVDARGFRLDDHALISLRNSYYGSVISKKSEEYIAVRVGPKGELLFESSKTSNDLTTALRSIENYSQRTVAHSYGVCQGV